MFAVLAAEPGVDTQDRAVVCVEPETKAVSVFKILEVEIAAMQRHLACVVEKRRIEARPDFKPVLGIRENGMRPAKPVVAKAAQRVVSTQMRHEIERHTGARSGLRCRKV